MADFTFAQREALMRWLRRCEAVPLLCQAGDVEFPYSETGLTPQEAEELFGQPTLAEVRKAVELRLGIWLYIERARERQARRQQGRPVDGIPYLVEHDAPRRQRPAWLARPAHPPMPCNRLTHATRSQGAHG